MKESVIGQLRVKPKNIINKTLFKSQIKGQINLMEELIGSTEKGMLVFNFMLKNATLDNIVIESTWAVDPDKKLSTTWVQAKVDRDY